MRVRRGLLKMAALASVAVAASLLAAPAASAAPPSATVVRTLPFLGGGDVRGDGSGGPGTARANAAVSRACNEGQPVQHPQWYHLPGAEYGYVVARVDAPFYPRGVDQNPSGVAVVSSRTGHVLTCSSTAVRTRVGQGLDVVAYYTQPVDACADPDDPQYCADGSVRLSISATSHPGGPANDHWQHASRVRSLPYTGSADTTFADADVTGLVDYEHCLLSSIDPAELATAFWSYTPRTTGPAPDLLATADDAWDASIAYRPQVAILERSGSTLTLAPRSGDDPWDCEAPTVLTAGRTYYFAVFTGIDRYSDSTLVPGGPMTLRVGASAAPSPARSLAAAPSGGLTAAGRLSWAAPTGGAAVTGYRVGVQRRTFGGRWATVRTADLPASATAWMPPRSAAFALRQALRWTVQPRSAHGVGPAAVLLTLPGGR